MEAAETPHKFLDSVVSYCDVVRFSEWVRLAEEKPAVLEALVSTFNDMNDWMHGLSGSSSVHVRTSMISDSFIISSAGSFKTAFDSVAETTMVLECSMAGRGAFLRGAICTGPFYHEDGIALGTPLIQAVALEENEAYWPRVILHPSIVRELHNATDSNSATFNLFDAIRYVVMVQDWYQLDALSYVYHLLSFRGLMAPGEYDREWKPLQATFRSFREALEYEVAYLRDSKEHPATRQRALMQCWTSTASYLNGAIDRTLRLLTTAFRYRPLPRNTPLEADADPLLLVSALQVAQDWCRKSVSATTIRDVFAEWWRDREADAKGLQACRVDVPYLQACWNVRTPQQ